MIGLGVAAGSSLACNGTTIATVQRGDAQEAWATARFRDWSDVMDVALILLGAVAGFLLAVLAEWARWRQQEATADVEWRRRRAERIAEDRMEAYVRLMEAGRKLRFLAKRVIDDERVPESERVDALKSDASVAYYEIVIMAPEETRQVARTLRRAVFNIVEDAGAGRASSILTEAQDAQTAFEEHVRKEVGVATSD